MDEERIRNLRALFAKVETRLKNIEYNADGNLSIPCINQLRYVGNHLLEYLVEKKETDLTDAEGHCARALFDAYEVEALYYLKTFQKLQEDYNDLAITDCVSDYLRWCRIAAEAKNFVRQHSQSNGRGTYYDAFELHVTALQDIHPLLPHARDALNRKRRQGIIGTRWLWAGMIVGVLGLGFGLFAWMKPDLGKELWVGVFGPMTATHVAPQPNR
jgi:hypothetical protein